jgi:hypothetical protein
MMKRCFRTAAWIVLGVAAAAPGGAGDEIRPHNTFTTDLGALVDGKKLGSAVNDESYTSLDLGTFYSALFPVIPLDNFVDAAAANEIIAFARRRPPVLVENVPWTPLNDRIDVDFEDEYLITVHVWIVQGPFETLAAVAANANVTTSGIWAQERQGIAFDEFNIIDATDDPDAAPFLDFKCFDDGEAIKTQIGHIPGAVNIYYVSRVGWQDSPLGTGKGVWCSGAGIIAMGKSTSGHLLAHELGHAFNLSHPWTSWPDFDDTNVMYQSSSRRRYLTEGQTFRAVFHGSSVINSMYDVRTGELTRDCGHYDANVTCPALHKRIWSDGWDWPPN